MTTGVDHALELDSYGWNVVPAPLGEKLPSIKWIEYQKQRTSSKLRSWFSGQQRNYFIVTGAISGLIVLDCDNEATERWFRDKIGDELLDRTTCVRSSKGHHFYFELPADERYQSRSEHEGELQYDLRAEGTGVIAPPSVHASGRTYEWLRGPSEIQPAPEYLLQVSRLTRAQVEGESGDGTTRQRSGDGVVRSMLSGLLANPGQGGRNNWVTAVLGHYAKTHRRMQDLFEAEAERVWEMAKDLEADDGSTYTRKEFDKTVKSVWGSEMRKGVPEEHKIDGDCGWLASNGDRRILAQVRFKNADKEWEIGMDTWSDFDLKAHGVVEDEDSVRVYDVEVLRARRKDARRDLLPATVLSDGKRLAAWLGEHGVGIFPPEAMWPKKEAPGDRLRSYIEAQNPPHFEVVDALGWYEGSGGFVCHEGVITEKGLTGFQLHKPHPRLAQGWAPYRYGFSGTWKEAQALLREVLTFHDETVCAVFGSWWASCLLKPQIQEVTSQFPFMALEAPSESGKTTGFFSMLLALGGNKLGNTNPTQAALRDYLSGNQSGVFWIDDLNSVHHLMELLRQATGDGAVSKKGEDKTSQAQVRLVSPICLSGESLPIRSQKALVDRAVMLDVPSPTQRRSLHNPENLQWADIVKVRTTHPDLTAYAGWYVSHALKMRDRVLEIPLLVPDGGAGRWGDKMAVVRFGARMLAEFTGDDTWVERVDAWVLDQYDLGNENTLTLKVLPEALAMTNWLSRPVVADRGNPATPAFVDEQRIVWFSPMNLGQWWKQHQKGQIEVRTETADALQQQARALGLGGAMGSWRKQFRLQGADRADHRPVYWRLSGDLSDIVLRRSRGEAPDTTQQQVLVPKERSNRGAQTPVAHPVQGVLEHQERQRNLEFPMSPDPSQEGF